MRTARPSALAERTRSDHTATMSSSSMVSCSLCFV
jgi:hypothetical protein